MKFLRMLAIIMLITFLLTACDSLPANNKVPVEQSHLYWKDVDVVVTDIEKRHWFATTHWYSVEITVKSEEYNLTKSFDIRESGAFNCPKEYNYEVGDVVKANLCSWVMDSTGEVVRREIEYLC